MLPIAPKGWKYKGRSGYLRILMVSAIRLYISIPKKLISIPAKIRCLFEETGGVTLASVLACLINLSTKFSFVVMMLLFLFRLLQEHRSSLKLDHNCTVWFFTPAFDSHNSRIRP